VIPRGQRSPLEDRSVLVTGATGLVGGAVVDHLLAIGARPIVFVRDPDRRSYLYVSGDIARCALVLGAVEDGTAVERAIVEHEVDTVIHLAAQPIVGAALRSPLETFEANIRGTYNVLEACRRHRDLVQRIVVASSDKAYGDMRGDAYDEAAPLSAKHPYDVSKACADMIAQGYAATYATPVTIARCGNIYGPGDLNWSRIVPGTIRSLQAGTRPILRSDGTMTRDYIYVRDVARAYAVLAERAADSGVRGEAFNFSAGQPLRVIDVVLQIASIMGKTHLEPIIEASARHEIPHQVLSLEKVEKTLGWKADYRIADGLHETVDWYVRFLTWAERGS
jgi:CDP-glucose 4,6-dehydratase